MRPKPMNKEAYIIDRIRRDYPDIYKSLELDYMIEETDKVLKKHHFEAFLESLNIK